VGSIPDVATLVLLLFLEQETLLTLLQSTQLYKWGAGVNPPSCNIDGCLVITGEATVRLLSMSANGCGPGGTLCAHTTTLGMVQPQLWGTSPPPDGFASTGSQRLSSAQALQCFTWIGVAA